MRNNPKVLGLTGGIASGKTAAAAILREAGGYVFDADKIAHAVIMKGKPAYERILSEIGGCYLDAAGQIDRGELGAIVFNDKSKLTALEKIVHKYVIEDILSGIERKSGEYVFFVIDAPLLFESGLDKSCNEIWVIRSNYEARIGRLKARNRLTYKQAADRIALQKDWDNIQSNSYIFIENNGNIDELADKVHRNLRCFLGN